MLLPHEHRPAAQDSAFAPGCCGRWTGATASLLRLGQSLGQPHHLGIWPRWRPGRRAASVTFGLWALAAGLFAAGFLLSGPAVQPASRFVLAPHSPLPRPARSTDPQESARDALHPGFLCARCYSALGRAGYRIAGGPAARSLLAMTSGRGGACPATRSVCSAWMGRAACRATVCFRCAAGRSWRRRTWRSWRSLFCSSFRWPRSPVWARPWFAWPSAIRPPFRNPGSRPAGAFPLASRSATALCRWRPWLRLGALSPSAALSFFCLPAVLGGFHVLVRQTA